MGSQHGGREVGSAWTRPLEGCPLSLLRIVSPWPSIQMHSATLHFNHFLSTWRVNVPNLFLYPVWKLKSQNDAVKLTDPCSPRIKISFRCCGAPRAIWRFQPKDCLVRVWPFVGGAEMITHSSQSLVQKASDQLVAARGAKGAAPAINAVITPVTPLFSSRRVGTADLQASDFVGGQIQIYSAKASRNKHWSFSLSVHHVTSVGCMHMNLNLQS